MELVLRVGDGVGGILVSFDHSHVYLFPWQELRYQLENISAPRRILSHYPIISYSNHNILPSSLPDNECLESVWYQLILVVMSIDYASMIKLMKIGFDLPELAGNFVICRPRVFAWMPVLTSKPSLTTEYSPSASSMPWKSISAVSYIPPLCLILRRPRRRLDLREAFKIAIDGAKFRISILTDPRASSIHLKIDGIISSGSWSEVGHFWLIHHIYRFGPQWVLLVHAGLYLVLILRYIILTLPGPGLRWSWGTRYDLSGDLSLEQPKLTPFVTWGSNRDLIWYLLEGGLLGRSF